MTEQYVKLPKELTAENGAKALLMGEFKETIKIVCPECYEAPTIYGRDDCDVCDGNGYYYQEVPVGWTTIKEIYKMIVDKMGVEI